MGLREEIAERAAEDGRTLEQQAAFERLVGAADTVREQQAAGIIPR